MWPRFPPTDTGRGLGLVGLRRGLLCLLLLGSMNASHAASFPWPALSRLENAGLHVSARVIDLETGQTLGALHPAQSLIPASVTKLYTSAAVLDRWGAAKRFVTKVLRRGAVQQGVLDGDLVFVGGGDPGLTNAQLWTLAQRVRAAGIRTVRGRLLVEAPHFGPVACITTDRCRAHEISRDSYNAPLSSAGVDYSNACLSIRPASRVGVPAHLSFEPFDVPMLAIRGQVETLPANRPGHIEVIRRSIGDRAVFEVSGGIALGADPQRFYRSIAHPNHFAGQVFRGFLQQAGVQVHGPVVIQARRRIITPSGVEVAQVKGRPLGELLRGMLIYSNNYMADTLALDWAVAGKAADFPGISLPEAGRRLTGFARAIDQHVPFAWAHTGHPVIESGSGLTTGNRLSADDVTALLVHEYHRYADFPAFLAALTVPDQTPVDMLKGGSGVWDKRIAAKTGSLNQPVSVFALAGYLRLKQGRWGAFAVLVNGSGKQPHAPLYATIAAVRSDLEALLHHNITSGS